MRSAVLNIWFHDQSALCQRQRDIGMTRVLEFQGPRDIRLYTIDETVKCGLECYATAHVEHYATVTVIDRL